MTVPASLHPGDSDYYTYPPNGRLLTRVSTVLSATTNEDFLAGWYAKKAGEYAADHIDEIADLLKEGDTGRDKAIALIKGQAKRITKIKADAGTYVHAVSEALCYWAAAGDRGAMVTLPELPEHLAGAEYDDKPLTEVVDAMADGFVNFFAAWDPEIIACEMTVYNPDLGVAGTLDLIIRIRDAAIDLADGTLYHCPGSDLIICVDIKTGKNEKLKWRDQIASYRRMRQARMPATDYLIDMPPTTHGAILHLRPEFPDGWRLLLIDPRDDTEAWNRFRRRCEIYFGTKGLRIKPGTCVYPPLTGGERRPPRIADLDGMGYGRALKPLISHGFEDLADLEVFTAAELVTQVRGIGDKTVELVAQMMTDHGRHLTPEPSHETAPGKAA